MSQSRIPGFYELPMAERRIRIADFARTTPDELAAALDFGGIDPAAADNIVENVIGTYALPFGIALNFQVNAVDRLVPMVVEEPSVIAAASNAARMVRRGGGFLAEQPEALMIGQIEVHDVPDAVRAAAAVDGAREELLRRAVEAAPGLVPYGGGPRGLEIRDLGGGYVVVHVLVDCCDAMGANMVNTVAEALGPRIAELTGGSLGLRILTNLADRRRVRVSCRVPAAALVGRDRRTGQGGPDGAAERGVEISAAIETASRFAEADPYRAATHNKGIMNGVDAVAIATGNDWRAIEAGAHAFAARSGRYRPLSIWRRDGDALVGTLEMPMAVGIVGGTLRVHPAARVALKILAANSARDLAFALAAAGLASNLAAVRALATEGINRGHMALHARSVAVTVGASGREVDALVDRLVHGGVITLDAATEALAAIRDGR
ncbi:MAG: hydroxymethylglutaryl-CoA reductase, degradative [Polyangiaceae bacterium]|nr:hydroxymethylglutaryl-CoA reductase, degradative [Polyangiaceae bacterium]